MRRFFYLLVLLCAAQTMCAQRTNDRYPALRYWDFRYSGSADSVDCLFNAKNKELFISGFDTDGKGTFYFAEAVRCACRASRERSFSGGARCQMPPPPAACSVCAATVCIWCRTSGASLSS